MNKLWLHALVPHIRQLLHGLGFLSTHAIWGVLLTSSFMHTMSSGRLTLPAAYSLQFLKVWSCMSQAVTSTCRDPADLNVFLVAVWLFGLTGQGFYMTAAWSTTALRRLHLRPSLMTSRTAQLVHPLAAVRRELLTHLRGWSNLRPLILGMRIPIMLPLSMRRFIFYSMFLKRHRPESLAVTTLPVLLQLFRTLFFETMTYES